ncbi:protein NO VEIN domain-containing protein [Seleniivibrio woodruffii]|uniref:protein NO VEIN domain-containing protein n=1 Tax=Seleniivibrio woodruffii TaxID=1078050 RepID=UPI002409C529|nr:DUF3883 domain-containing protein [Seleniivibrio woodruffii]
MRVLFARVGYMVYYQGSIPGDEKPIKGGKYNKDDIGHEIYNFKEIDGCCYGYFQPNMQEPYSINLKRIDSSADGDEIDDVLVIWFASNPQGLGQVIIGWYNKATVFRHKQNPKSLKERDNCAYYIKTKKENAVLLPLNKRTYYIGNRVSSTKSGNPGQSNTFYILDGNGDERISMPKFSWLVKAIKYVNEYSGITIDGLDDVLQDRALTAGHITSGQGFANSIVNRLTIEEYSMSICKEYYEKHGYDVQDVSKTQSFDFYISNKTESFFVEVKGTQSLAEQVIFTYNEVELHKNNTDRMILFIVHSIKLENKKVKHNKKNIVEIKPWKIDTTKLKPISYMYKF